MAESELAARLSLSLQWLLGGVVVVLYASDRFNEPLRIRAMTTFERYWIAWFGYIAAMLGLFTLLGGGLTSIGPAQLLKALGGDGIDPKAAPAGPLFSALILTSLLPHVPVLKKIDAAVKAWFQRVGNVPFEVRELSSRLRRSAYEPQCEEPGPLKDELRSRAFDASWLRAPGESFSRRWAELIVLFSQVETWKNSRAFGHYVQGNQVALTEIRSRVSALEEIIDAGVLAELDSDLSTRLTVHMRRQVAREFAAVNRLLFDFVAGGILSSARTPAQRRQAVEHMGFRGLPAVPSTLSAHDLVLVAGLVFLAMLFIPLMIRRFFVDVPLSYQSRVVVMVPIIYAISIVLAIYPKSVWTYAMRLPGQPRPFAAYAVSGIAAAVTAFFVSVLFRFAFDSPGNVLQALSTSGSFARAWNDTVERWPWLLMTFFVTVCIAWAADDECDDSPKSRLRLRLAESMALAVAFGALAWVVVQLLTAGGTAETAARFAEAQLRIIATSATVGAIIGAFVPHLYRTRGHREDAMLSRSILRPAASGM